MRSTVLNPPGSSVTSNEIDDKCTFKILCVNFFRITYAAVLRLKHLTSTSSTNYIGYFINYLQVGFFLSNSLILTKT